MASPRAAVEVAAGERGKYHNAKNKKELVELCRERGIQGNSNMTPERLVEILEENDRERRSRNVMIIPEEFHCPITHEIMKDPVITCDGHSYERSAITDWFQQIRNTPQPHNSSSSSSCPLNLTSPHTNEPLQSSNLYPNHALRNIIEKYAENNLLLQQSLDEIQTIRTKLEKSEKSIRKQLSLDSRLQKQLLEHISNNQHELQKSTPMEGSQSQDGNGNDINHNHPDSSNGNGSNEETESSVIESVISKERSHLDDQQNLLREKLSHKDKKMKQISAQKEEIQVQLLDQRSLERIQEMEQSALEEIAELRQIQSMTEQEMTQLANEYRETLSRALGQSYEASNAILKTVYDSCQEPQISPLLRDYAAGVMRYKQQQQAIDEIALRSNHEIQPLKDAHQVTQTLLNEKLEVLETIVMPSLLSEEQTLLFQIHQLDEQKECLNDLKLDLQDSLHWAKISTNGFYQPSQFTIPTVLLCFKVHNRLELQCGKGKNALKNQGMTPSRLRRWGCTVRELKNAGFSPQELKDGNFSIREMRKEGFSLHDLIQCGYPLVELKGNGFSTGDLFAAGFSVRQLREVGLEIEDEQQEAEGSDQRRRPLQQQQRVTSRKRLRRKESVVCSAGDDEEEEEEGEGDVGSEDSRGLALRLSPRRHTATSAPQPSLLLLSPLYTTLELRRKRICEDFTATEAREAHCRVQSLKEAGFSSRQIYLGGYSLEEMKRDGITTRAIERVEKSAKELREERYPARVLNEDGFLVHELYEAGYTYEELQEGGYSAGELRSVGCPYHHLKNYYRSKKRMLEAGFTEEEILLYGNDKD
jgi:hypothetical protein